MALSTKEHTNRKRFLLPAAVVGGAVACLGMSDRVADSTLVLIAQRVEHGVLVAWRF